MVKYNLTIIFILIVTPALAEDKFVPFTIDETTYKGLLTYLGDVPSKYANPLISLLVKKEAEAVETAALPKLPPIKDKQ